MRFRYISMLSLALSTTANPAAAAEGRLTVVIGGLGSGHRLPDRVAFCAPDGTDTSAYDISPAVRWSKGPGETRSYVLLMVDPDVPADLTLIDRPGVSIAADAPRQSIYHWVLADVPATTRSLAEGADGRGLVPHGKPVGDGTVGIRGANAYTQFLRGVPSMTGTYGGYDGPCPPRNDARVHRYIVTVYALDVPTIGLGGAFGGSAVEAAMAGHILARGSAVATYRRPSE